ncbi:hypothetical protein COU17_03515 [Candidatus Kaiserbacteria bacterium CG10_big_fil_rev_8_21_14_0_10_49_17]|uniref:Uncharacterized protein n=1 Tax=Candidatus Kaiserbacteria bacterium CG10_big_fil_rev_8_21_14_0_10_49_17 TaxID=1974609 RepID=A0A2M6WDL3_9BACT|nr:MAG: hypothetical protein COU17_03515 [Candidatus Kaiserbacteria bacterium CG10_big_fil_rev_8_21_14_0_10_49_17]
MEKLRELDLFLIKKFFEPLCRFVEGKIGKNQFWQARMCMHVYIVTILVVGGLVLVGGIDETHIPLSGRIFLAFVLLLLLLLGPLFIHRIRILEEKAQRSDYALRLQHERLLWPMRLTFLAIFSTLSVWNFFHFPILIGVLYSAGLQGYVLAQYLLACEPKTPEKKEEKSPNLKPASA